MPEREIHVLLVLVGPFQRAYDIDGCWRHETWNDVTNRNTQATLKQRGKCTTVRPDVLLLVVLVHLSGAAIVRGVWDQVMVYDRMLLQRQQRRSILHVVVVANHDDAARTRTYVTRHEFSG